MLESFMLDFGRKCKNFIIKAQVELDVVRKGTNFPVRSAGNRATTPCGNM
jgi:hypothetical protein